MRCRHCSAVPAREAGRRTLRNGSRGSDVEFMQRLLVRADVRDRVAYPCSGTDGLFGSETERAVRAFQRRHTDLTADGVVGSRTWAALGLHSERLHPVTLIGQPDGTSCWSAAASMILGNMSVGAGEAGRTAEGRLGNSFANIEAFARSLGWRMPDHTPNITELVSLLVRTPLWIGVQGNGGGHAVALTGVYSDGDPSGQGTMVRDHDPSPPLRGIVYATFVTPIVLRGAGNWIAVSLDYLLIPA